MWESFLKFPDSHLTSAWKIRGKELTLLGAFFFCGMALLAASIHSSLPLEQQRIKIFTLYGVQAEFQVRYYIPYMNPCYSL